MGDQRSYAEVVKDANQQLDNMAGEGSHVRVADDVLAGKKEEGNPKKVKSPQSANIPELKRIQIPCGVLLQLQQEKSSAKQRGKPRVVLKRCVCGINC